MVLKDTNDGDVIVARISSQVKRSDFDVEIVDWQQAGLLAQSIVRIHKLATLEKSLIERSLGILSQSDWNKVQIVLKDLLIINHT